MPSAFEQDGIRFQFPENWQLNKEETDSGWTITLQSPNTAFFLVSYDGDLPDPDHMAQTTLDALRDEYQDVEADPCLETVSGQSAVGFDIRFMSLDLTNSGWSRSFYGGAGTVLLYWQVNDLELKLLEPVLRAIAASVIVEED